MTDIILAFTVAVLAAVLPTAAYVLILWWFDRYEKEPVWLFTVAFLWGALPAVVASLITELVLHLPSAALGSLSHVVESSAVAPLVEEVAKGVAVLAIFLLYRAEFDGVLDGIIYGAVVGFGFAMTENGLYFFGQIAEEGMGALGVLWLLRAVIFGLNHALFTALTGAGLGFARLSQHTWQRWLVPPLAFGAAVALHATHNLFTTLSEQACWSLLISLASDWGGLIVVLAVILLSWREERRWLVDQLRDEVAFGVITAGEYGVLASPGQRLATSWLVLSRQGWSAARAWRRREAWATELAFKKHQLASAGHTAGEAAAIDRLRAQLRSG